jgi:hypothetical protein
MFSLRMNDRIYTGLKPDEPTVVAEYRILLRMNDRIYTGLKQESNRTSAHIFCFIAVSAC